MLPYGRGRNSRDTEGQYVNIVLVVRSRCPVVTLPASRRHRGSSPPTWPARRGSMGEGRSGKNARSRRCHCRPSPRTPRPGRAHLSTVRRLGAHDFLTHLRQHHFDFIAVAEQWDKHRPWGEQWQDLIGELYHLNDARLLVGSDPVQWAATDTTVRAAVEAMEQRRERELAQPKLPQVRKKVLTSLRKHWSGLIRFVDQPELPMDNNQAERALRGPVVGRKELLRLGGAVER